MKKLSARYWRWLKHRSQAPMRARKAAKRAAARPLPPVPAEALPSWARPYISTGGRLKIGAPEVISFTRNQQETADFLQVIRSLPQFSVLYRRDWEIDFTLIRELAPAAALCVVSELDRWRQIVWKKGQLRPIDLDKWDSNVRRLLDEMGFFEVLGVEGPVKDDNLPPNSTHWIRFKSGISNDGSLPKQLRIELQQVIGVFPRTQLLYDALVEAMANAIDHAYPSDAPQGIAPPRLGKRWWMSGSVDKKQGRIQIIFFDQGITIPVSLPRWTFYERAMGIVQRLGWASDDGHMIAAAMEARRSATEQEHRGKGFANIQRLVDDSPDNKLRIISRRGCYIYRPDREPEIHEYKVPLNGTLIAWDLSLAEPHLSESLP